MEQPETLNAGSLDPVVLRRLAADEKLMEVGRKAIEETLVEWRDAGLSQLQRNNGLCIRYKDGTACSIVRFGPEVGVSIALKAIADAIEREAQNTGTQRGRDAEQTKTTDPRARPSLE